MTFRTASAAGAAALALLASAALGADSAPAIPAADVLTQMERVADWQLAHPSVHPATDWTQAAGDAGFMALAGISPDPRYEQAMLSRAEASQWRLGERTYHADDHCVGQTYAELYLRYRDPRMIAPLRARFDGILARPPAAGSLDFTDPHATDLWSWCDSLFMGPPTWVRLYAATGDRRYLDFAVRNWWKTAGFLYDRKEHLFFRDSTYLRKREANARKVFWSRGNGWVLAGLVRVLQFLPENHPARPRFEALFRNLAERILSCQQPDGLWRPSLLDPAHYPLRETSGSGFFTYALAWGVNEGLLPADRFAPAARKGWAALAACVDADGRLGHVQPIGADPKRFAEGSTEVYGVGAFLLAGSEIYRMSILARQVPVLVKVTNPAEFFRARETVELDPRGLGPGRLVVMAPRSSRILDSQQYASEPGRPDDTFLFQADLGPQETRTYRIFAARDGWPASPRPVVKTCARQITTRYNDMAWESDRIAHRLYQAALIRGEGTISSGIDVWTKRTRALVIDEWYGRPNYHRDDGDGLDDYQVGRSRGCGGLGIWSGGRLHVSSNFTRGRVITTGPIRSEFELSYAAWDAGGRMISERKRISIDAGSNLSHARSTFAGGGGSVLTIGVGLARRADPAAVEGGDRAGGWMTCWQAPDRDRGRIGCAVVLKPGTIERFVDEAASVPAVPAVQRLVPGIEGLPPIGNRLALTRLAPGATLDYYFGAGWSKSGDFPDGEAWIAYVRQFARRVNCPLRVVVSLPRGR